MGLFDSLLGQNPQQSAPVQEDSNLVSRLVGLEERLDRFRLILSSLSTPFFAIEPDGSVFFYSQGAAMFLGIPAEEVLGRAFAIVMPLEPKDQIKAAFLQFIERKDKLRLEVMYKQRPVLMVINPIFNDVDKRFLGGLIELNDLTQEKNLERKQIDFVAFVSHELRTPISIIKGYLDVVLTEADYLKTEHREFVQRAYQSNQRQEKTVEKLLDLSRLEQSNVKVNFEQLNLNHIVSDVQKAWIEPASQKGLQLHVIFPRFPLPGVRGDEDLVRSVLNNLLENAIKYTEHGSIAVEMMLHDGFVETRVKDTGVGIPTDMQSKLFSKFFRGSHSLTETAQGAGLGLYLAKQFVELMGGRMWLKSTAGVGSEFMFTLPVSAEDH